MVWTSGNWEKLWCYLIDSTRVFHNFDRYISLCEEETCLSLNALIYISLVLFGLVFLFRHVYQNWGTHFSPVYMFYTFFKASYRTSISLFISEINDNTLSFLSSISMLWVYGLYRSWKGRGIFAAYSLQKTETCIKCYCYSGDSSLESCQTGCWPNFSKQTLYKKLIFQNLVISLHQVTSSNGRG